MQQDRKVFVGLDTSKLKMSVALAEEGRQGEVRFLGNIDNTPDAVRRLVSKLSGKHAGRGTTPREQAERQVPPAPILL
jgi:transposase